MSKYLSPKADLTFKRVFGEHKDITISFLNAMLQFSDSSQIVDIEYQTSEMIPDTPTKKYSIVDVKCTDDRGRYFIVEMQMVWNADFKERILHNTTRAYSRQLDKGEKYSQSMPVYCLCLLDDKYVPTYDGKRTEAKDGELEYYQCYKMREGTHPEKVIEGLNIILIELPKFKAQTINDKKMMVLWLRFLTEISEATTQAPPELVETPIINKALDLVERSAYSDRQIDGYDSFWQDVRYARSFDPDYHHGLGMEEGLKKGREEGKAEGLKEGKTEIAKNLKSMGMDWGAIAQATVLSMEEIENV